MKTNLPVILLKTSSLLPYNELKFEIDNDDKKNILDLAELFHENKILIVSQINPLEESLESSQLPKIGIIAKIKQKMELPNGKTRVLVEGLQRAEVTEYLNLNNPDEFIESFIKPISECDIPANENQILSKKLYKELTNYTIKLPYVSNSILGIIENSNNLSEITDIIAPQLPLSYNRFREYIEETSCIRRTEMILEDIYNEIENYNIEKALDNKIRQELEDSQREFILREKMKYIKETLGEVSNKEEELDKMRKRASSLNLPEKIYSKVLTEISRFEMLNQTSPEVNVTKSYIDWILDLPWNNFTYDNKDLSDVRKILDESHYGLEEVKTRIVEYIAVQQMTNKLNGPIICLVGPPGVGKTSLSKSIAKAMNRNFVKMSVGGLCDESEIRGHRKTYLGANPGRIIQSMKKAGSNNPVFLIDELDKMTKDVKGDPASALLDILDPEQNKYFSDNFIEEEYDLSNVMFITTANYIDKIPEALKDRLEIVELSGYTELEKLDIAKKHLIPNIMKEHGLNNYKLDFNESTILRIINEYTKESGVRELNRQISKIIRKIVTSIVQTNIKVNSLSINDSNLEKYLGKPKYNINHILKDDIGVVNGLAYTVFGGDTLQIEVNLYKGTGKLELTGSLGEVMKESAQIALSYVKSNHERFGINYDDLTNNDIHIHVPDGAVKKDGPSAGVTLVTALISALTNMKISSKIAMTGEITLRGHVLQIGGLKEKSIGAYRNKIETVFIPYDNLNDMEKIPNEIKEKINFVPVKEYIEIYNYLNKE